MGCHTWFRNKVADMPPEHLERLRQYHIKGIKNAYIYKCSLGQWLADSNDELNDLEQEFSEEEKKGKLYKMYRKSAEKWGTKEYYEKHRNQYKKDLETLQNPKATRLQLLRVFKRHDLSFELDRYGKEGSYEMSNVGWYDQYRVSGYPGVTHHNAEEAIKFLEEYDNGNNIVCGYKTGMCDEIREIVNDFFKQFPNGTIHYG